MFGSGALRFHLLSLRPSPSRVVQALAGTKKASLDFVENVDATLFY
jgi:hypothetical protein